MSHEGIEKPSCFGHYHSAGAIDCEQKGCVDRLECKTLREHGDKNILDRERFKDTPENLTHPPSVNSTVLVSFESGHYKKLEGKWKGDSIWAHWQKPNGKTVHINKDKVEYYEEL